MGEIRSDLGYTCLGIRGKAVAVEAEWVGNDRFFGISLVVDYVMREKCPLVGDYWGYAKF